MNDDVETYTVRPVRPPRYIVLLNVLLLADSAICYAIGYDGMALARLLMWIGYTAVIGGILLRDARRNARLRAMFHAHGLVENTAQNMPGRRPARRRSRHRRSNPR